MVLETSAIIKLFVDEPHSETVRKAGEKGASLFAHAIAYAEVATGLAKAHRMRRIDAPKLTSMLGVFDALWASMEIVQCDDPAIRRAGALALTHSLRAYDALHLSAAERVWANCGRRESYRFVVFDDALRQAAMSLGIPILPDMEKI